MQQKLGTETCLNLSFSSAWLKKCSFALCLELISVSHGLCSLIFLLPRSAHEETQEDTRVMPSADYAVQ